MKKRANQMLREATNDSHKSSPANKLLGFLTLWDSGPILERRKISYERSWLEHLGSQRVRKRKPPES